MAQFSKRRSLRLMAYILTIPQKWTVKTGSLVKEEFAEASINPRAVNCSITISMKSTWGRSVWARNSLITICLSALVTLESASPGLPYLVALALHACALFSPKSGLVRTREDPAPSAAASQLALSEYSISNNKASHRLRKRKRPEALESRLV